ncbi:hypothetical protein PV325_008650, partial [Microctonus aethiopoides]
FERLREEQPDAISRVKVYEGNLRYDNLGLKIEDLSDLKNIEILFHAAGPFDEVFDFCHDSLPKLRVLALATSLFKHKDIFDDIRNEKFLNIPVTVLRFPCIGPAYKEPIPGFVEIMRGSTAIMVGAGYARGRSDLPAEIIPIDLAVNAIIIAAWERGIRNKNDIPTMYNLPNLECTWSELIKKGRLAHRKFPYPTFGIRGMTSIGFLHWIVVFFLEWLPSAFCDNVLSVFGAKPRCLVEYTKVHETIKSIEEVIAKPWFADRIRINQVENRLTLMDRQNFPVHCDIDLEAYILCAAASARKNCINEANIKIVNNFNRSFMIKSSVPDSTHRTSREEWHERAKFWKSHYYLLVSFRTNLGCVIILR